ncbi:MAG: exopolysaccharide biosynthesis protein [Comamonas sp.]
MLSHLLTSLIDDIHGDTITLKELLERSGRQGMLLICALATLPFLIPVSIPGVSTVFGAAIVLLAAALFLNRLPWLPQRILNKPLDAKKLVPVLRKGVGVVSKIDRWVQPRWLGLTSGTLLRLNCVAVMFGGVLLMAPLGPIPFSNTAPAVGILLLTVGLLQRDGLFVILGYFGLVLSVVYFSVLGYLAWTGGTYLFG